MRVDLAYTDRNEQSTIARYSDLAGTTLIGTSAYSYDDAGRLTGIVNKNASNATLSYYNYSYDNADRVSSHTWWSQVGTTTYSGTRTYSYDATSQLTDDSTTAYSYDANGNRTMAGYATGTANRMTNDGVYTYTYDAEGNLTQKSKGASQETWYYTYDNANRLTNIRETSNGTTDTLLLTYTYDAENKRVKEQTWGGSSPAETRFVYDGANVMADLDSGNNVTVRRMFGDQPDQLLSRTVTSGGNAGLWFYQTDNLGSVRDLVDANSLVKSHLEYDGYGVRTDPQSSISDRYGYTGREWQNDAGVQYNWERWYDAKIGKWLREDPIEFNAGDANLYRYVGNQTTFNRDPNGLMGLPLLNHDQLLAPAGAVVGVAASLWKQYFADLAAIKEVEDHLSQNQHAKKFLDSFKKEDGRVIIHHSNNLGGTGGGGFFYFSKPPTIVILKQKISDVDIGAAIYLYELIRYVNKKHYNDLFDLVKRKKISKEKFVLDAEKYSYQYYNLAYVLIRDNPKLKDSADFFKSRLDEWKNFKGFQEHQKKLGHSKLVEQMYDNLANNK